MRSAVSALCTSNRASTRLVEAVQRHGMTLHLGFRRSNECPARQEQSEHRQKERAVVSLECQRKQPRQRPRYFNGAVRVVVGHALSFPFARAVAPQSNKLSRGGCDLGNSGCTVSRECPANEVLRQRDTASFGAAVHSPGSGARLDRLCPGAERAEHARAPTRAGLRSLTAGGGARRSASSA